MTWTCPREGCDLGIDGHDLALAIEHIYSGVPTKDGGTFDAEDARDVADRVARRLWGDDGRDIEDAASWPCAFFEETT